MCLGYARRTVRRAGADSGFYGAPLVQGTHLDEERNVSDSAASGFAAGFEANPRWNFELALFRGRFDGAAGDDLTMDSAGVNALRVFGAAARVAPYTTVWIGRATQRHELSGLLDRWICRRGSGISDDAAQIRR